MPDPCSAQNQSRLEMALPRAPLLQRRKSSVCRNKAGGWTENHEQNTHLGDRQRGPLSAARIISRFPLRFPHGTKAHPWFFFGLCLNVTQASSKLIIQSRNLEPRSPQRSPRPSRSWPLSVCCETRRRASPIGELENARPFQRINAPGLNDTSLEEAFCFLNGEDMDTRAREAWSEKTAVLRPGPRRSGSRGFTERRPMTKIYTS